MSVSVTGGGGYIGSLTCLDLLMAGHEVLVVDNFSNRKLVAFDCIERICGHRPIVSGGYED